MRPVHALILLSSLITPALSHASDAADVPTQPVRISTGVVQPVLLNSGAFSISAKALSDVLFPTPKVVLALTVNQKGTAEDIRVIKSVSPKVDAQVLSAARDFRFRPASLDHQPVAIGLQLTVVVQR